MNNKGKGIFLHTTSLVDLKAEVLKKRELLTQAKLLRSQNESTGVHVPFHKPGLTKLKKIYDDNVKRKNLKKEATPEICDQTEIEDALRKSKLVLERKAKLYEKITSGEHTPGEVEGELYLVNFEKKIVDKILQQKAESEEKNEAHDEVATDEPNTADYIPLPPEPENQWVEYVDKKGRKKCCLKEDFDYFTNTINEEKTVQKQVIVNEPQKKDEAVEDEDEIDVHYQDLKDQEIRLHGVGYYGFSVNSKEREEQMERLKTLREQTLSQRENRAKLKEKRKALLKERLAKIKKRKQIATDDAEDSKSEDSDLDFPEETVKEIEIDVEEVKESEKDLKRKLHVRPWDKGKNLTEVNRSGFLSHEAKTLASHFKWIEERRNERPKEFAPPNTYRAS